MRAGEGAPRVAATLDVILPGPPVAQGRPRLTTRGGRAHAYDPEKSRDWKRTAARVLRYEARAVGFEPQTGPLDIAIVAVFSRPQRIGRSRKGVLPRQWRPVRPDSDNLAKAVLDAGTDAGLWLDDAQIVRLIVEKWYAASDEAAKVIVSVREA